MKRTLVFWMALLSVLPCMAGTVPQQITYQGTIKERGVPVTGDRSMLFRLTNVDGSIEYWNSGPQTITVSQGLFSTVLQVSGVNWQAMTPYLELSVGPKAQTPAILLPREPITATAYSLMSETVVDGAITSIKIAPGAVSTPQIADQAVQMAKLDAKVQNDLVPAGAIVLFKSTCPAGWSPYLPLVDRMPMGAGQLYAAGSTGGALTHAHPITSDGSHDHGGATGVVSTIRSDGKVGGPDQEPTTSHTHPISTDGGHNHGGATQSGGTLPPYVGMTFCEKQ